MFNNKHLLCHYRKSLFFNAEASIRVSFLESM